MNPLGEVWPCCLLPNGDPRMKGMWNLLYGGVSSLKSVWGNPL